jgi:hypothetical protein
MARHRFIVNESIIEYDLFTVKKYPIDIQQTYSFFHQMGKISGDKGSLIHDDSIDATAGSVRHWVEHMAVDETTRMDSKTTDENVAFFAEWGADISPWGNNKELGLSSDRFKRKQTRR